LMNNIADFIEDSRRNIEKCFADCECTLVKVPFRSDPRVVLEYMRKHKLIKA